MVKRAKAREQAFILIFEKSFSDQEIQDIIEVAKDCLEDYEDNDFTTRLALGTIENIGYIDEIIEKNSIGWSTKRISKVALAIMRLCCYEIFYEKYIPKLNRSGRNRNILSAAPVLRRCSTARKKNGSWIPVPMILPRFRI